MWLHALQARWGNFQKDRTSYMGLQIGANMDEAVYTFGEPTDVLEDMPDPKIKGWMLVLKVDGSDPKNAIPSGKTFRDYTSWMIDDHDGPRIDLTFDAKTKKVIKIGCYDAQSHGVCPPIFGINTSYDEDQILEKLGKPEWHQYVYASKSYKWDVIGLEISLSKKHPYNIVKNSGGHAGFIWFLQHQVF